MGRPIRVCWGCPLLSSGSGYTLQVLTRSSLRAFRCYPSADPSRKTGFFPGDASEMGRKKFPGRGEVLTQKKFVFPTPAVPDVNSKKSRRGQSSIGASCYRFKIIFRLEINFICLYKSLKFNMLVCFFGLSPGFECKQSIWAPGMETLLSFYSKNQMKIELRTGIGQLWKKNISLLWSLLSCWSGAIDIIPLQGISSIKSKKFAKPRGSLF